MYDKPKLQPPGKRNSKAKSSAGHALEERPSSGLRRDALLNRQQRYERWAEQIRREDESIKKADEDRALTIAFEEPKMTKAEKRQSASMLKEAERAMKEAQEKGTAEDPEKAAITRQQQREVYEWMGHQFEEIIARMDANCHMLKEAKFREFVYLLCDGDDNIVHEMKKMEKTKREIMEKRYRLHYVLYELYQEEQSAGKEEMRNFEMSTARLREKPLGVSVKEISANLQVESESEEGD